MHHTCVCVCVCVCCVCVCGCFLFMPLIRNKKNPNYFLSNMTTVSHTGINCPFDRQMIPIVNLRACGWCKKAWLPNVTKKALSLCDGRNFSPSFPLCDSDDTGNVSARPLELCRTALLSSFSLPHCPLSHCLTVLCPTLSYCPLSTCLTILCHTVLCHTVLCPTASLSSVPLPHYPLSHCLTVLCPRLGDISGFFLILVMIGIR